MSQSGTQKLISRHYAAFNRGDWESMLALLHEDLAHDLNQGSRECGREMFRAFLVRMNRCYREQLADIRISVGSDGSHAAAEYVVHGEYLHTDEGLPVAQGQRYVLPGGAFFDVCQGRIARVANDRDWPSQHLPSIRRARRI